MTLLDTLLQDLPAGWTVTCVDVGNNWILSQVEHRDGRKQAGVAAAPRIFPAGAQYPAGTYNLQCSALPTFRGLYSDDLTVAAVGLATFNAVRRMADAGLRTDDAADWLAEHSKGRKIAFFGRFPFIKNEIDPVADEVFVFEQLPQSGEYTADDIPAILPRAEIIAITGTTVINHTLDEILAHTSAEQTVVMLGPSTPLSSYLFDLGIDALFGVRVADVNAVQASVRQQVGFQKIQGLRRVSLLPS